MENKISILILGSGAREHALARKLAQSPLTEKVLLAPGNGGTAIEFENITVDLSDFEDIARLILKHRTELVVIGPEQPLVDGLVDFLEERPEAFFRSVHLVGPGKACAALEGSKDFSKLIMEEAGIPTAAARTFFAEDWQELEKYLLPRNPPFVIKADGLASGKGVAICQSIQEALEFSAAILKDNVFAAAKPALLVEEFLTGIEISMFLLSDGLHYLMLPEAKDYKRILDGDLGPNTGGMGSVSPVWFADREFTAKVRRIKLQRFFVSGADEQERQSVCHRIQCPPGRPGNPNPYAPHRERSGPCFTVAEGSDTTPSKAGYFRKGCLHPSDGGRKLPRFSRKGR
jgi:phosphoribosylamine--glycine ligase